MRFCLVVLIPFQDVPSSEDVACEYVQSCQKCLEEQSMLGTSWCFSAQWLGLVRRLLIYKLVTLHGPLVLADWWGHFTCLKCVTRLYKQANIAAGFRPSLLSYWGMMALMNADMTTAVVGLLWVYLLPRWKISVVGSVLPVRCQVYSVKRVGGCYLRSPFYAGNSNSYYVISSWLLKMEFIQLLTLVHLCLFVADSLSIVLSPHFNVFCSRILVTFHTSR
jgi:hypothetical protein